MINKVSNIAELRSEKARLVLKKQSLEVAMKNNIAEIKNNLNPLNFLKNKADELMDGENGVANNIIGTSLAFGLDFLFTRLLFRKSNFLKKTVLSLLIQMAGSKMLAGKSEVIFSVIKKYIEKLKAEKENQNFDRTTAADKY